MKQASKKAKGTRLEKWVVDELTKAGIDARKQPGSGAYSGFPHDVECFLPEIGRVIVECKARKEGFRQLDKWMGDAELLVIKKDRGTPNIYMSFNLFKQMVAVMEACDDVDKAS